MEKVFKLIRKNKHLFSDWTNYIVWDIDGTCWEFENKPYIYDCIGSWRSSDGRSRYLGNMYTFSGGVLDSLFDESNWKESLFCLNSMSFVNQ